VDDEPAAPVGAAWPVPAAALCAAALAATAALGAVTGWREIGDDAPHLLELVRAPWILFRAPEETGLPATWRSFPPLLPPLFGLGVRPWLAVAGDFAAIRLGVVTWTLALLVATDRTAIALGLAKDARRRALLLLALAPGTLAAAALLPQEESYVALVGVALFAAAAHGRFAALTALAAFTPLGGKVFLAALAPPLAASAPLPFRALVRLGAAVALALGGWLALQTWRFGSAPLLGYDIDPATSISVFALLSGLGAPLGPGVVRAASAALSAAGVLAAAEAVRRGLLPALHGAALALFVPVLTLSIAMPPYALWSLPFVALAIGGMARGPARAGTALVVAWGGVAYACKLLSGVALAAEAPRDAAKGAVAGLVFRLVGDDLPFRSIRTAGVALLLAIGAALCMVLWREGRRAPAPGHPAGR
jgi:hypothetical protein